MYCVTISLGALDLSADSELWICCHGLHVDTGNFKPVGRKVDREQRFCLACDAASAEDEHHFVFDCPPYILFKKGQT